MPLARPAPDRHRTSRSSTTPPQEVHHEDANHSRRCRRCGGLIHALLVIAIAVVGHRAERAGLAERRRDGAAGLLGTSPVANAERVTIVMLHKHPRTTMFSVEQAPTRDAVPLNVDVVISWRMHGTPSSAISDRQQRLVRLAQMALRELIARSLAALRSTRSRHEVGADQAALAREQ